MRAWDKVVLISALIFSALFFTRCASNEGSEPTFDVPRPSYEQALLNDAQAGQNDEGSIKPKSNKKQEVTSAESQVSRLAPSDGSLMRHTLRQLAEYDSYKMGRLVNREINIKGGDDESYLNQVAIILGQTVLIQPHFTERENALKELKGKIDQDDYVVVIEKAADDLLNIIRTSHTPSDQAGALVALTNLVTEVRTLKRPELKDVLQKIADAKLSVSDEARKYASDPMEHLTSPSREAEAALKTL